MKRRRLEKETKASLAARSKGSRGKIKRDVKGTETRALLHNVIDPLLVIPQVTAVECVHMQIKASISLAGLKNKSALMRQG